MNIHILTTIELLSSLPIDQIEIVPDGSNGKWKATISASFRGKATVVMRGWGGSMDDALVDATQTLLGWANVADIKIAVPAITPQWRHNK